MGSDDSDPNPQDGNADVVFNVFKSPELVFVMKGGRERERGGGGVCSGVAARETVPYFLSCTHTHTQAAEVCTSQLPVVM